MRVRGDDVTDIVDEAAAAAAAADEEEEEDDDDEEDEDEEDEDEDDDVDFRAAAPPPAGCVFFFLSGSMRPSRRMRTSLEAAMERTGSPILTPRTSMPAQMRMRRTARQKTSNTSCLKSNSREGSKIAL